MGLSRNKVAVSEGAAGSPPFYGETRRGRKTTPKTQRDKREGLRQFQSLFNFQGPKGKLNKPRKLGGVAQLGEHLPCKQGVKSSNLFISTSKRDLARERVDNSTAITMGS